MLSAESAAPVRYTPLLIDKGILKLYVARSTRWRGFGT